MSAEQLFKLAYEFAEAHAAAELQRAGCLAKGDVPGDSAQWNRLAVGKREEFRTALREAFRKTLYAGPDDELPVCTRDEHSVDIRAILGDCEQRIRVRYTPAQAVVAGAAMIACASVADDLAHGALANLLLAFPSNNRPAALYGAHDR